MLVRFSRAGNSERFPYSCTCRLYENFEYDDENAGSRCDIQPSLSLEVYEIHAIPNGERTPCESGLCGNERPGELQSRTTRLRQYLSVYATGQRGFLAFFLSLWLSTRLSIGSFLAAVIRGHATIEKVILFPWKFAATVTRRRVRIPKEIKKKAERMKKREKEKREEERRVRFVSVVRKYARACMPCRGFYWLLGDHTSRPRDRCR